MFINLFKLITSATGRTPLEDFTTESFSGLLRNPDIRNSFIRFLGLPSGNYSVGTQKCYSLVTNNDCRVDLVLENREVICFIEVKVNSKEGNEQLSRYCKALDLDPSRQAFLFYITKNQDPKHIPTHNFSQFRWHEIARWLQQQHKTEPLVTEFINFLSNHQMTINTDISRDTIIALNNFSKAFETMEIHLKSGADEFRKVFPGEISLIKKDTLKEIKEEGRISCSLKPLLRGEGPDSEFLFAVHFEEAKLQTQMWFHPDHPQGPALLEKAKSSGFEVWNEEGYGIYLDKKLDNFIDHSASDEEIRAWFRESFGKFRKFIEANPEVSWNDAMGSSRELV